MPASVDSTHPQYDAHHEQWKIMRDLSAGEAAVKDAGVSYLPKLGGQDQDQYVAYLTRASFYNATGRTIDGLSGMVFRKPPVIDAPEAMTDFRADVTLNGIDLQGFAEQSVEEVLTRGRGGILVDFPRVGEDVARTQAEADRMSLRPFWSLYTGPSILNWRMGQVGNRTELMQVRLREVANEPVEGDEFGEDEIEQVRVLDLSPVNEDGTGPLHYRQRVFRKSDVSKEWEQFGEDIVPLMQGQPLTFIPFVFLGPRDTSPHVCKPPLIDLAYVNLSHYRTCADLEHGAHFTALPTPYIFGAKEEERPQGIGPEALWYSSNNEVTAGLIEFQGQGLEALETRREVKEAQMASLGARMLAPEKRMAEAAETATIHRQGEISVLASLAQAVSAALTQAMEIARDWMGLSGDVAVGLNDDYLPTPMDPQRLMALFQMVQGGRISQRTFFEQLQAGEIIAGDKSFEDEQDDIAEDGPALGTLGRGEGLPFAAE